MSETKNIHIIVGGDDFLVESAAKRILEAAVEPALRSTAVEYIDGKGANAEAQLASLHSCVSSIQTPPFLDPVKLTWWQGVDFLPVGGGKGPSAAVKEALESFARDLAANPPPPNQVLIVTATALMKTSVFARLLAPVADIRDLGGGAKQKPRERRDAALMRLPDMAAAEGLKFDQDASEAFISKVGTDTRFIVSELAKLHTYLGGERSKVTCEDVAHICSIGGDEPEIWDVTDALAARNPARLVTAIQRLDGDGKNGITVANVSVKFFRDAIMLAGMKAEGLLGPYGWANNLSPAAAANIAALGFDPKGKMPYPLQKCMGALSRYSLGELRLARFLALRARERLVSSSEESSLVLQELLAAVLKGVRR